MSSGISVYALAFVLERTFCAHTVIKMMWCNTCDFFWETITASHATVSCQSVNHSNIPLIIALTAQGLLLDYYVIRPILFYYIFDCPNPASGLQYRNKRIVIWHFNFPKVVQAHTLGEVGNLGTVLLRVYSGTVLPIFIEIGLYLEQNICWHSFLRHGVFKA